MKIVFMGTPAAAAASLGRLLADGHEIVGVYTQPDRPSGRGNKIVFSPVKQLAAENGLRLFQPSKIRTPDAAAEFTSLSADVAVVVAYGRILPSEFLNAFPQGAINVHFSLLPKYRGAAPVNWAIVNGEERTGVTTIRMDEGLDTGDVLLSRETTIGDQETAPELMERLSAIGAGLISETLQSLDELEPKPQEEHAASYAPIMKKEDGLIDWDRTSEQIANRVRGFQPFPGTFTYFGGLRMNIWSARPADPENPGAAVPGEITAIDNGTLVAAAGSGTFLRISEIQFEGKRRMSVKDALNGSRFVVGGRFVSAGDDRSTAA